VLLPTGHTLKHADDVVAAAAGGVIADIDVVLGIAGEDAGDRPEIRTTDWLGEVARPRAPCLATKSVLLAIVEKYTNPAARITA